MTFTRFASWCSLLAISLTQAVSAQDLDFNPLDPFKGISTAQQWQQFRGTRESDPDGPFHNRDAPLWLRQIWQKLFPHELPQ